MAVVICVGGQWGDEGKGKVVDLLAETADMVVRSQGGNNAGHTVVTGGREFRFNLIPAGILHPRTTCVIGNGVVLDPRALLDEIEALEAAGADLANLVISERAHMIMPYHPVLDRYEEEARGDDRLGTTYRGVGPAYSDKVRRIGFRVGDLEKLRFLEKKLDFVLGLKNEVLVRLYGAPPFTVAGILDEFTGYAARLARYIRDPFPVVQGALARGERIILEGAQGTMLDLDLGTYPYVTSSYPSAGGALAGAGIGPRHVTMTLGVVKAYTTRVGYGPFPTELAGAAGEYLRETGREYGTTTGRPRRVGWFDAAVARYGVQVNGVDAIALTKLDVLDGVDPLRVCIGYRSKGVAQAHPMANISHLKHCQPVYEELPGWRGATADVRRYQDLPPAAQGYVERIEELVGAPVTHVSVGPDREQTIVRARGR
ncbi:MAG TPA: adenylosuccinate synthase [Candidatus Micrarchaeia archaeon]|nr:adenylosuccinate synthase [Candidatus Micrarchaeia archaeon]